MIARKKREQKGIITWRNVLTRILDGGDNEAEAVREGAPRVGDVFQCHEVRARINRAHGLLRVLAGQVCLENKRNAARSMRQQSSSGIYACTRTEEEQPRSRFHGCQNAIGRVEDERTRPRDKPTRTCRVRTTSCRCKPQTIARLTRLEANNCSRSFRHVLFLLYVSLAWKIERGKGLVIARIERTRIYIYCLT